MTFDIEAIKRRVEAMKGSVLLSRPDDSLSQAARDREALLAEVDRLTKNLDRAFEAGHEAATNCDAATNKCRRLSEEHERLQPLAEWLPIETAPKDGTRILCAHPHFGVRAMHFEQGEWWLSGCSCSDDGPPTHWQPLPEPPK